MLPFSKNSIFSEEQTIHLDLENKYGIDADKQSVGNALIQAMAAIESWNLL